MVKKEYITQASLLCAIVFIVLLYCVHWLLPLSIAESFGAVLIGTGPSSVQPFTVQNVMWIVFFFGLGEVYKSYQRSGIEVAELGKNYLPEDSSTMLRSKELVPIYNRINQLQVEDNRDAFLPQLIKRVVLQFQSSNSTEQAHSLLSTCLELFEHEIDLRYTTLRYIIWLIPTLGFIGTVIGIAMALYTAGHQGPDADLMEVTELLGVAFYTTLLALLQSAVLMFGIQKSQAREERTLNHAAQYCLDNLINRLYN